MKSQPIVVQLVLGAVWVAAMTGCSDRVAAAPNINVPKPSMITMGQLDPGHPYVGGIILDAPSPSWFPVAYQPWYCSGTLVSNRVVLTAAHCFAFAAQATGYAADALPTSRIHVSFAANIADPRSWRSVTGYLFHPNFAPPFSNFDVALLYLSQPVNEIPPGHLAPRSYLDSFKNADLQAATLVEVGYGMLGADSNFALTGDRRISTVGFQQLVADFMYLERTPSGPCIGDSGGPILLQSGGVEYVVAELHGLRVKFNTNTKQDCTSDFPAQRLDLGNVVDFIQANINSHEP